MIKKSGEEGTTFNTLRSYAKHRILNDMVDKARRHAQSKDYMIMILDQAALRVFSSCCKFFDVYKANLYHIERLEVRRKRFPHTDALYFISPTLDSIQHLLNDFNDQSIDVEKKPQQYRGVHICFTSRVSDDLLKLIAQRKHLAPRVLSFNEINLDFFLFNDNVYHLSRKNILPAFKFVDQGKGIETPAIQRLLDEFSHRLFTVCSVFMEFPAVQYQGNSPLCKALAIRLNDVLTKFYQSALVQNTAGRGQQITIREPRGTLLLIDRSFDLISPVMHDYSYQSLVYEFFKVGEEGEITLSNNNKMVFLNDQDDLWTRFRNKHIAGVHATLNKEVSVVAAESKRKVGSKSTDEMSLQDMADVLRTMPKYEEMMKKYQVHMELINKGITDFTSNNLRKLIALEQDIISGVDAKGNKVNNTTIVKEMSQMSKTLRQEDYVRLLMIYFVCYDLNRKDKDTLLKSVESDSYRSVLENIEYLDSEMVADAKKFKRRREEMSSDQFSDYTRKLSASEYEILRTEPKVCSLIKQIHEGTIDVKKYPLVVERQGQKKPQAKETKKKGASEIELERQDALENPRIFVFVFGGLSHHELVSIENLQEVINAQIIPGANEIIQTSEFLSYIEKLHKKDNDQAFLKGSRGDSKQGKGIDEDEGDLDETNEGGDNNYAINF